MAKFDYSEEDNLLSSSEYDKHRTINANPEVDETQAGYAADGVLIQCTCSTALKIVFWVVYALLAAVTIVWILMGHLDQTYFNLIVLVLAPFIFRFLTVTKTLFRTEGIEAFGRIMPWDAIIDLSINESAHKIFVETSDGYTRTIRVHSKVEHEEYVAVQVYAKRMLTMSAKRVERKMKRK